MTLPACRFCGAALHHTFVNLGMSPLANAFLKPEQLNQIEPFYPLHARVCGHCFLVQLEQFEKPDNIFGDYAYFSSYSESWLNHAREYAEAMVERFHFNRESLVIEIASNDGYLLQYFHAMGVPVLGVEPAQNLCSVAKKKGIRTVTQFFNSRTARELLTAGHQPDLIVANNVLAHVPDLLDFVSGLKILLKPRGILTLEFPHLLRLLEKSQFDTIYHEHFSYFSFCTAAEIFAAHGLTVFDVEELPTHGGSLRIFACHTEDDSRRPHSKVVLLRKTEIAAGLRDLHTYSSFAEKAGEIKRALLEFLIRAKCLGNSIVGYGAPAKGNTLLNYCGVDQNLLEYTVDRNPHKQGLFLPGTHIPILHPDRIRQTRPDYVLILPWNLRSEILEQLTDLRQWGCRFVIPIPTVEVVP
jgi:2-polyprenyl-3-methyl-5-hydroxy-6-metoxy-1,4-benzoquinol methylase